LILNCIVEKHRFTIYQAVVEVVGVVVFLRLDGITNQWLLHIRLHLLEFEHFSTKQTLLVMVLGSIAD